MLVRGKFSFLYVDTWFNVIKCKFIGKKTAVKNVICVLPYFCDRYKLLKIWIILSRVLATIKNYMLSAVFPIWTIVELPKLCFPNTQCSIEK